MNPFIINSYKYCTILIFCWQALSRLEAKGIKFPSNLKVRDNNSLVDSVYSDDDSLELGDWIDI